MFLLKQTLSALGNLMSQILSQCRTLRLKRSHLPLRSLTFPRPLEWRGYKVVMQVGKTQEILIS